MPNSWKIKTTAEFDSELKQLLKAKSKTDKGSGGVLRAEYENWIRQMLVDPMTVDGSRPEPYPQGYAEAGRVLRKIHYKLKSRGGGHGQIRLIYEVHPDECCVTLLCCYSHGRYAKRLTEGELVKRVKAGRRGIS